MNSKHSESKKQIQNQEKKQANKNKVNRPLTKMLLKERINGKY